MNWVGWYLVTRPHLWLQMLHGKAKDMELAMRTQSVVGWLKKPFGTSAEVPAPSEPHSLWNSLAQGSVWSPFHSCVAWVVSQTWERSPSLPRGVLYRKSDLLSWKGLKLQHSSPAKLSIMYFSTKVKGHFTISRFLETDRWLLEACVCPQRPLVKGDSLAVQQLIRRLGWGRASCHMSHGLQSTSLPMRLIFPTASRGDFALRLTDEDLLRLWVTGPLRGRWVKGSLFRWV